MPLNIPIGIKLISQITVIDPGANPSDCLRQPGHCFGSDGGSGVSNDLKVTPGQGGEQEVWTLDPLGLKVTKKELYHMCQYCQKGLYIQDV